MTWPADSEPISRWSAMQMIGKGVEAAPALRRGIGATFALAMVGAAGRVVVPILVQQAIDRGFKAGHVDVGVVMVLGVIGLGVIIIATIAQRAAVNRLGMRSEEGLYTLRVKLFEHIHRLSLADHGDERKGGLVARVTSDVETLPQFFS